GCRRHRIAEQLFRRGKFGRERTTGIAGQLRRFAKRGFVLQQLRDAEVQQLDDAAVPDQHVRRLDVPVNDKVGVSVGDRGQNVEEQTKTRSDTEPIDIAIGIDPLAFDVLEDQIRLPGRRDAGVDQAGDVRMRKTSKDAAFAAQLQKPRGTLADVEVERSIEQRTQSLPAVVVEDHRGYVSGKSLLSAW